MLMFVRFLVLFFCLNVVVRFVRALWHTAMPATEPREAPRSGVSLVRDRVCNTFLPRERAIVASVNGHEEYFCCERCRSQAQAAASVAVPVTER